MTRPLTSHQIRALKPLTPSEERAIKALKEAQHLTIDEMASAIGTSSNTTRVFMSLLRRKGWDIRRLTAYQLIER